MDCEQKTFEQRGFTPVTWRGTASRRGCDEFGISFDSTDGSVIRLALKVHNARFLVQSIVDFLGLVQSDRSTDILSKEESIGRPA